MDRLAPIRISVQANENPGEQRTLLQRGGPSPIRFRTERFGLATAERCLARRQGWQPERSLSMKRARTCGVRQQSEATTALWLGRGEGSGAEGFLSGRAKRGGGFAA